MKTHIPRSRDIRDVGRVLERLSLPSEDASAAAGQEVPS
jgi:hypothetical protein